MDPSDTVAAPALPRGVRLGVGAAIVAVIVAVIAIAAVVIGVAVWRGATAPVEVVASDAAGPDGAGATDEGSPDEGGAPGAPGSTASGDAELFVHVSGAVEEPGLYALTEGARVMDAVAAAGGLADDGAAEGVNLARPVTDGEQIVVPTEEQIEAGGTAGAAGTGAGSLGTGDAGGVIDLNAADATQLETLPGIGPALAGRIVAWREENGGFSSVDDLLAVSGIGEKVLAGLRDAVLV